jgi:hypothetical protein
MDCFDPDGKVVTMSELHEVKQKVTLIKTKIERINRLKSTFMNLKAQMNKIVTDRITQQFQVGAKVPEFEPDTEDPNTKVAPRNMRIKALVREVNPLRIWTEDQLAIWIDKLIELNS